MPKNPKKSFLNELGYTELSEKENELLNKHFNFENIDDLVGAFNNTETKEEYNTLFDRINNLQLFQKNWSRQYLILQKKKRIKNVIKTVANILIDF